MAHRSEQRMQLIPCLRKSVTEKPMGPPHSKQQEQWMEHSVKKEEEKKLKRPEHVFDPLDPDGLVQCPYDPHHQIRSCRFPYHLVKCMKNHQELASKMVTCPFNARHILSREDLSVHISTCDNRRCIEPDIGDEKPMYQVDLDLNVCSAPPSEEDWDEDPQSNNAQCVRGPISCPCPRSLMDPNNGLGVNLRAPKSVPYVQPWKLNNQA